VDAHEWRTPADSSEPEPPAKVPRRFVGPSETPAPASKPERKSPEARSWDKLLLVVGAAVVVAAILIVPGILNRGGQNPVAEAAQATMDASGVRMTFTMSMQGPVQMTMQGSGVMNGETKRAALHLQANGGAAGDFQLDEVVDEDLDIYMRSPVISSVTNGKSWLLIKGDVWGDLPDSLGGTGMSFGPRQQLDALESVSDGVSVVGHEPVNGVSTTHYTAVIDLEKLIDQLPNKLGEMVGEAMADQPGETVDAWIDDQGLLRRARSNVAMGPAGSFSMTMDFSDYGIHPQIDLPAESDAYDVSSLIEDQLGS
jgi:hypothetical protein